MRIAIVNDVSMVVAALTHVILEYTEHTIAWTAADGVQAVEQCAADRPDAILMDLIMPHMDGIEASKRIMDATPCAILVVTASVTGNSAKVFEAMAAGALDAISTPTLGGARTRDGIQSLKKKLDSISHLISRHTPAPQPAPALPTQRGQFSTSLIAIGSSTGGPGSLAQILSALPADFSAGIVIIQHVDSHFAPGLAQWLNDQSPLNVRLAEDGDRPQAGTVLIAGTSDHFDLKKKRPSPLHRGTRRAYLSAVGRRLFRQRRHLLAGRRHRRITHGYGTRRRQRPACIKTPGYVYHRPG